MQTLTFTQKLLRQRSFFNFLIPLLAVFVGLGASQTALAQSSTVDFRNVIVTYGTSAATQTTNTFDAVATRPGATGTPPPATASGGAIFDGTDFGPLSVDAGRLLLEGGTIAIREDSQEEYFQAFVVFGVAPGTLADATGPAFTQSVQLTQTSYNNSSKVRTFTLNNAARNILAMAMQGGSPGTDYRFDIGVRAVGTYTGGPKRGEDAIIGAQRRRSMFTATGVIITPPTLTGTTALISSPSLGNVNYDANNVSANPDLDNAFLGQYDVNTGQLLLNGGTATTTENGPNTVSSVILYYRVRSSTTGGGAFQSIALTQTSINESAGGTRTRTFSLSNAARNLLAGIGTTGNYNLDVYLQASGVNSSTSPNRTFSVNDDNDGQNYIANFIVNGTPFGNTVWTGGINDNWFDARNWNNGVPNMNTNATIPNFPSGTAVPYPNIYSDAMRPPTAATTEIDSEGNTINIPASAGYDNSTSGNAMVRNLVLQATSQLDRSILRLVVGQLDVFGDFMNEQGSFIQRAEPVISFKGGNQTISGSANGFTKVEIDGTPGSIKTLVTNFNVRSGGYLKFINGILVTNGSAVSTNFVEFAGTLTDPNTSVVTPAAQLIGENENSYLRGYIKTTQVAATGVRQNFSNIGLALTFTGSTEPGAVFVSRNTTGNTPPSAFGGASPKPGIRRTFGVQPGNAAGARAKMEFRYLDNELVNLRLNDGSFNGSVDENKLSLYLSTNGTNTYSQLGRDGLSNNVLVKNEITAFNTFTLSEALVNPLPVTLTTFNAERMGADALITWETASEFNSKGFEVQVSTDGQQFRTLGSVASATVNSTKKTNYSYVDTEANKVGTRYYRLRQIDVNGKDAFFSPRTVLFTGNALANAMVAYPNPINGSELRLVLQSVVAGKGQLRITDITGRVIRQESVELTSGVSDLSIKNLGDLKAGMYLVGVTLPTGETQNLKIVKQ
ncbi:T9SS type A sorting domain-containing protein [Hymenobacter glacialis]|nr:T9SS type A sorting domain-containing protein [Hymenobacter glacialis]